MVTLHTADPRPDIAALAHGQDVALLRGAGPGARALAAAAGWRPTRPPIVDGGQALTLPLPRGPAILPEEESGQVLPAYGIPLAAGGRAGSPEEAATLATKLGFPVVVKVDGPAHKARAGGVSLDVWSPEGASQAAERLGGRVRVSRQLPPGPEVMCGVTLSRDVVDGVRASVGKAQHDDEVKVVAVGGAGGSFSAGFDIKEEVESDIRTTEAWRQNLALDGQMTMELWDLPEPTIASVRGYCLAGALELAMACDIILCAEAKAVKAPERE